MKLIDLTCSKCNAQLQVNSELTKCICNYCGNEMLVDDEVQKSKIQNGFELGYQMELGRIKAQEDIVKKQKQQELEHILAVELENKKKEEERQKKVDEERKLKEQIQKQREYELQHKKEQQIEKIKKENQKGMRVLFVLIAIYLLTNMSKCGNDSNKPSAENNVEYKKEVNIETETEKTVEKEIEVETIDENENQEMSKEEIEAYTKGQQMGADAANYLNNLMSE